MELPKIKRCPMCGDVTSILYTRGYRLFVMCSIRECSVEGPKVYLAQGRPISDDHKRRAIEKWNRRARG